MKILITTDWYKPVINGVVTSVVNLAESLSALGHEVRILTLSGTRRSYTEGNVTYLGSVSVGLVYLGRLAKEKNVSELLTLLARQNAPQLRLLLVGGGPYRGQLEKQARELGLCDRAVFAGMVPPAEAADYYQLGDAFVSASQSETQGLTYIEAMAAGLPLLCRYDPCLDGVIQSGINGFTYQNEAEFHSLLNRLLADPSLCRALGGAARTVAFRDYSAESFAEKAAGVYQALLRQGSAADAAARTRLSA